MAELTLVVADKNYSSWSMRPWVVLSAIEVPFEEKLIELKRPHTAAEIAKVTPSGRVPALVTAGHGTIWDSLAIIEYLAEVFPDRGVWPEDVAKRARARALACEMHSSFQTLRTRMPMNIRRHAPMTLSDPALKADIDRVQALWMDALARSGGPFLFGGFTAADAFYAPVVTRFRTYGVPFEGPLEAYGDAVVAHPAVAAWIAGAEAETHVIEAYEVDVE